MEGKEALNIIKNNKGEAFCEAYEEPLNAIQKDLERLEKLENNDLVKALNKANKKYLKVLDILKNKIFVERFNNNEFGLVIDSYCTNATTITKEEYEMLKEVLGNE